MKLFVYGDSYSACDIETIAPGWPNILAKKIECELTNRAVSGGSTENAMNKFTKDLYDNLFCSGDLIVFQFSTIGRLFFNYQTNHPSTASLYLHEFPDFMDKNQHRWYFENKQFIEWFLYNCNFTINEIQQVSFKHVLKNFAESRSDLKIVILELDKKNIVFPFGSLPNNLFIPNIELNKISVKETKDRLQYNDWTRYTGWDVRINHMSNANLHKLVDILYEMFIQNKMLDSYDGYFIDDCFDLIVTPDDYKKYAQQGLLYDVDFPGFKKK